MLSTIAVIIPHPRFSARRYRAYVPTAVLLCCVLIWSKSAHALPTSTLTLAEVQAGEGYGYSVATGDVNDDGRSDVIVGAPYTDGGAGTDAGAVYVYYGGSPMNATPDLTIEGEHAGEGIGYAVAAGDLNGDEKDDVIVGVYGYPVNGHLPGEVRVYFGGAGIDNEPDWEIEGTGDEGLGFTVAYAGDVNGDGTGDLIAGNAGTDGSAAYVYLGGYQDSIAMTLTNDTYFSVGGGGDVNGDDKADVVAGGALNAYVFYGGAVPNSTVDVTIGLPDLYSEYGVSVTLADMNGDGKADVIAGDQAANRAYVFYGGAPMDTTADRTYVGEANTDRFGYAVWAAGLVNDDAYPDLIVGAPYSDAGGDESGKMYCFFGGPSDDGVADLTVTGREAYEHLGFALAAADVKSNSHFDLVAGTYPAQGGATGNTYVTSQPFAADVDSSYYVPQSGSVGSPSEGQTAISNFYTCPNNDALPNDARIKLVLKDSNGDCIVGIDASDINIRFNGGTAAQGFTGPDADSVIANSQYNPLANCPDVRSILADAPSDANGVAYLTFQGASANSPGVAVRDSSRKWGHYDSEIPVYALGVKLQGRLTSASNNNTYTLQIKNVDVASGLSTATNQGELVNSLDTSPMQAHQGEADSAAAINWWLDLNSDGNVDSTDSGIQQSHSNHKVRSPNVH